jgi:predicted RNase H-like HicB family nuclease
MKVELGKEKDGYHAKVAGHKNLFAFGFTKDEALEELMGVVEAELKDEAEISRIEKKIRELLTKLERDE